MNLTNWDGPYVIWFGPKDGLVNKLYFSGKLLDGTMPGI